MVANLRSWWFEGKLRGLDEVKDLVDSVTRDEVEKLAGNLGMVKTVAAVALGPQPEDTLFESALARS
jgi:hypothetical protein